MQQVENMLQIYENLQIYDKYVADIRKICCRYKKYVADIKKIATDIRKIC